LRKKAATAETLTTTIGWKWMEMDGKEKPKVKADFRPGQKSMELGKTEKQSWPKGVGRRHCLLVLIKP